MSSFVKIAAVVCLMVLLAGVVVAYDDQNPPAPAPNRDSFAAMWLSIAHPALGEWYNAGWGGWSKCNQEKFWLGCIPFYGWPGYLQVMSAIDAKRGKTW